MPEHMPQVYEGDHPYIFVSYAHADGDAVLPIVRALVAEGYRVWYDRGIQAGSSFPDYIADHVYGCSCLLMFVSRASLASDWCKNEVGYALDLGRQILPVYLEDVELTRALHMRLGTVQALYWYAYGTDDEFDRDLFAAKMLDPCLTDEGRRRRGVKPRSADASTDLGLASQAVIAHVEKPGGVPGVTKRDALADYSWAELKALSRAIAAAASDDDGLEIARSYGLVDKGGRLRGDDKPLALKDGTRTSVRILGFRHDELVSGGKAGVSFEFADVPATHRMNSGWTNEGGWERSGMRRWLNSEFLALLPDDLRANIAEVRKRTSNSDLVRHDNDASTVTETSDKLWLLSMSEVYGRLAAQGDNVPWSPAIYDAEGTQYKRYTDIGATATNDGFCKKAGAHSWWWLRSPHVGSMYAFLFIDSYGSYHGGDANRVQGVSPGFCI